MKTPSPAIAANSRLFPDPSAVLPLPEQKNAATVTPGLKLARYTARYVVEQDEEAIVCRTDDVANLEESRELCMRNWTLVEQENKELLDQLDFARQRIRELDRQIEQEIGNGCELQKRFNLSQEQARWIEYHTPEIDTVCGRWRVTWDNGTKIAMGQTFLLAVASAMQSVEEIQP